MYSGTLHTWRGDWQHIINCNSRWSTAVSQGLLLPPGLTNIWGKSCAMTYSITRWFIWRKKRHNLEKSTKVFFGLVGASTKMSVDQSTISKSGLFFWFNYIVTALGQLRLRDEKRDICEKMYFLTLFLHFLPISVSYVMRFIVQL